MGVDVKAYYNDNDPAVAQWLRNLIAAGHLPKGDVDDRSIRDVQPSDLAGYGQAHFFAGIGGWPLALQLAGWPAARPVWTGSCPCQPFSSAGRGKGEADERHLWPEFRRLIEKCRPPVVFGEQVASSDGRIWLAGVRADLEAMAYAVGAADLCSAGVRAPHIRQRLYWLANNPKDGRRQRGKEGRRELSGGYAAPERHGPANDGGVGRLGDASGERSERRGDDLGEHAGQRIPVSAGIDDVACGVDNPASDGTGCTDASEPRGDRQDHGLPGATGLYISGGLADVDGEQVRGAGQPRPISAGFWRDYDVVWCDERAFGRGWVARRVEPGTFPLAHGVPGRLVKLRAYGNAISPQVAAEFVKSYLDLQR